MESNSAFVIARSKLGELWRDARPVEVEVEVEMEMGRLSQQLTTDSS